MITKTLLADELIAGMQRKLASQEVEQGMESLDKAVDYLNSAAEILDDMGCYKQSNAILSLLTKIAKKHRQKPKRPADPRKIPDRHTKGLTSKDMVENLKHHGTQFYLADDNGSDDLLDVEIDENNLEVSDRDFQSSFEDEI